MEEKYILTLDVGTTTIRSIIYNSKTEIVGKASDQVVLHYPSHGHVEIDPDEIWEAVVNVVKKSLQDASLSAGQMLALGISTQRGTFITWSKSTGKPFHNFITWKDLRSKQLVKQWNDGLIWKTTFRLLWALKHVAALSDAVLSKDALFGTLDTWLLYKLTGGKLHMTDASSGSATGFFDPFTMSWASWALTIFRLPADILPPVVDTVGQHFTDTDPAIWGHSIPIRCCMSDQTAGMWGACCFDVGDIKLTLGTGTFLNINTGKQPHASVCGFYPVVAWMDGKDVVFTAEGSNHDTASIVQWAQKLDLFDAPEESARIADSVPDSDGVFFIPSFTGLGAPYNDGTVASGFIGMKASTTKAHLVRAVLESLAFRTAQLYECAVTDFKQQFQTISIDGGVSNNDFIVQLIADVTGRPVTRPRSVEMGSLGCAHIIGLHLGIWESKQQLRSMKRIERVFTPRPKVKKVYEKVKKQWEEAVDRLCGWYNEDESSRSSSSIDLSESPIMSLNKSNRYSITQ